MNEENKVMEIDSQTQGNAKDEAGDEPGSPQTPVAQAAVPPPIPAQQAAPEKRRSGGRWLGLLFCLLLAAAAGGIVMSWDRIEELWSPLPWTDVYMITASEYDGTEITKEGGRFTARYSVDVVKREGWKKIPLLPSTVAIHSADLPSGAYLHLADGKYCVLTKRRGKLELSLTFAVAAKEAEGANVVTFDRVPSVTCLLKASLPGESLDVTVAGAQSTQTTKAKGMSRIVAALPDNTPIKITWKESLPKLAEGPPEIHTETKTLVSVTEGLVVGQTRIDFSVLHKATRELKMKVPAGVAVLDVTGKNIRDWRVENGVMSVQLEKEVLGPYQMNVKYETAANLAAGKLAIPVITGADAERDKGDVGIVALTSVEIRNGETVNAHLVEAKDLPAEISGMTSQPVLLAYRYSARDCRIALDINKHRAVDVLLTIIDRAHFTVVQALDGKRVVRGCYNVRNNRNQFLRIALPKDAELWSASVAGRTIQPVRDEQGRVLLPLIRSQGLAGMASFPVELVYAEKGAEPDRKGCGSARVELPLSSEPVMHMMVTLYVPEQGKFDNFTGTMKKVEHFASIGQPVPARIVSNVDVANAAQIACAAPAKPAGSDIDIQLPVTGRVFMLEKILVVKDQQWFTYEYWKLGR